MIDAVVTRFGLARMPFGRDLPPSRLHRHHDCGEAAARIAWAVADKTICMVTGEVGTGKTVAIRCAVADLDPASHTVIYIGNPATGVRGILAHVVTALGGKPVHGTAALAVQAWTVLAGERHARLGTSGDRLRAPRRCQTRRRGQAGVQAGAAQRRGQGIQAGPQRPGTRNQRRADDRSR
jgi:type II secretory pathway predicted ATPase ExeA